ncbi:hypothetical protein DPSP01_000745 [Paraphaeosphaeria sporulosa]
MGSEPPPPPSRQNSSAPAPPNFNQNYAFALLPGQSTSAPYPVNYSNQYAPQYYSAPAALPQSASVPYPSPYALPPQSAYSYPSASAGPPNGASQYSSIPQPQSYQSGPPYTYGAPPQVTPQQSTQYYPTVPMQAASDAPWKPEQTALNRRPPQHASKVDALSAVSIQDGDDPKSFFTAETLGRYTKMFPEAENDQGCRLFMYGPKCPTALLVTLFEHFDFPRYSLFPYGLFNDFSKTNKPDAGSCKCQRCAKGENCGHWALHRNLQFFLQQDTLPSSTKQPKVEATSDAIMISSGYEEERYLLADWNLQIFRFRSRRVETIEFAYDALIYQNYENSTKLRSAPLDYLLSQLEVILENWDALLVSSSRFLDSFRFEVLQERLEKDRNIVRNLVSAAQRWEEFRRVLQSQVLSLEALDNIHDDPRWTEGRDDYWEIMAVCRGYMQRFKAIDYRICTELINETDSLIQRVTNLISIDEGYRSRAQNDSIRRLSWITFIFLPLIFAAGIFGMNVDLFSNDPSWLYYLYTSLVVMCIAMGGYTLLRSRRRVARLLTIVVLAPLGVLILVWEKFREMWPQRGERNYNPVVDLENQELGPKDEFTTVLKWAASSGRTDIIHKIFQDSKSDKTKTTASLSSGEAIMMAIKNGHVDAAKYLIESEHFEEYKDVDKATLLHWAARYGQASVVEKLVSKGMSLNDKDIEGRTALDYALDSNDEDTINLLLKGGKQINRQDTVNIQTLHFSARTGDISMIKQLHGKGSSLEARDGKGQTVIFHAVKGEQYATLKWLLENNANVHAVDKNGFTALHIAAQESDLEATKLLVEKGANVNARSSERLTPLLCIVDSQGLNVLRYLHEKGADIEAADNDLDCIAHKAARKGDGAVLLWKAAHDLGCNITASGKRGNTPAHVAAESGSIAILKHLVEENIDIRTSANIDGYTPLMLAARAGKADAVRFLLENGCTHDIVDTNGTTLVELAIRWGDPSVMQVLQDFGAKFDSVDPSSDKPHPVWHAIQEGQYASVKQVLENGLDPNYTHRGISLLQCAIEAGNTDVARLLMDAGANARKADPHGWSPLHSAAFSGDVGALLLALGRAKDRSPKDEYGWTPLDVAAFYRYEELVKILDPKGEITEFAWSRRSKQSSVGATHYYVPPMEASAVTGYAEAISSAR